MGSNGGLVLVRKSFPLLPFLVFITTNKLNDAKGTENLEQSGFGGVAKIGEDLAQTGSSGEWVELGNI